MAQTQPNGATVGEVVVTGLRGSLQRDLDIKRNATGIVDAISAEDIGKFPDSNLAAAIQRIPGVSISRGTSSLGGVPTSTGDATEITVRGFGPTFNETLYDDRQVSAGTTNRGFDFSAVGADFVGEVDVLKTPDAALSSGAIGATINIKYPKPFDHPGPRLVTSLSTTYSPEDGHATPNGGVLISDTFDDDKIGFLADFAYSDHKTRGNHVNTQGWEGTQLQPGQLANPAGVTGPVNAWFIQDYGVYQEYTNNSREDGRVVLQWQPVNNFLVTLNDDYSRERVTADQNGYSVWFNATSLQNVQRDGNGTITNFSQPNTPTDFQGQINREVLQNNEYGLHAKWEATSNFTVDFDLDRSESWLNPDGQFTSIDSDVGYGSCASGTCLNTNNVGVVVGNGLPYPTGIGPGGNAGAFINNGIIGSHVFPMTSQQNDDVVNQGKLQGTWTDDTLTIRFGTQYVSDHDHLREFDTFTNNDWQAYSGYGPASGSTTGVALPQSFFTHSFSTSNFIPGLSGSGLPSQILKFNPYQVLAYLQGLGNPHAMNIPGFNYSSVPLYNGMYQLVANPADFQNISDDTWSGYLTMSEKLNLANMPLLVNVGVREEVTRITSAGQGQQPTSMTRQVGDLTALVVGFGPTSPVKSSMVNSYFLPNLDMNLQVTNKLKLRFDASRTLTRPPLADITPVLNVPTDQRIGSLTATGGNPTLQPYLSDNFDLGGEWYYARNSYISLDGFIKHVSNFVVQGTTRQTINNVIDPTTGQPAIFTVSTNVNGPDATVHGLELGGQHVFGNTGFGFQANATVVGSNKPYDPHNLSVSGFAVTGLADSANFVAFYDQHGFQARVAVNWRDSYLDHFGQQQNSSLFGTEPTFVDANTTVDFSTSYDITKNLSAYFEALNLSDSGYFTHGRFSNQLLDAVSYGRRFTLGVHMRL